jgi:S-adenosyl-L-methionine hydrolase (adenosine-forming)
MAIITITSDFGVNNYLVAALKGSIYQNSSQATIVDISHQIAPSDIYETAYQFKGALPYFTKGTNHLILSALFTNQYEALLIAKNETGYFYFIDNGTAPLLLDENTPIRKIKVDATFVYNIDSIFKTFAQALQLVLQGANWEAFTEPYSILHKGRDIDPIIKEDSIKAQIIYIDNFQNIVVNLTKDEFERHGQGRDFKISFYNGSLNKISANYASEREGGKLCFFNNAGFLEIAINNGNAAELFGLEKSSSQDSIYATVTIYFE